MMKREPFDRVVVGYGPMVLRVCRAVLGPGPDAEDAWSETFLSALRAWPDLAMQVNVEAWLVTIAHRKSIDLIRSRQRRAMPMGELPDRAADLKDRTDNELWAEVSRLPAKQRQVVAYRYLGGLSYQQIADIIGGSADAARRAAADGVKSLRHKLFNDQVDDVRPQYGWVNKSVDADLPGGAR